jgi:hypothetical protein
LGAKNVVKILLWAPLRQLSPSGALQDLSGSPRAPRSIAKLVNIDSIIMVHDTYIYIASGTYELSYNWWPHLVVQSKKYKPMGFGSNSTFSKKNIAYGLPSGEPSEKLEKRRVLNSTKTGHFGYRRWVTTSRILSRVNFSHI